MFCAGLLLITGCSEYGLRPFAEYEPIEGIESWVPEIPDIEPDDPEKTIEDCFQPNATAFWSGGEVWVVSNSSSGNKTTQRGKIDVSQAGRFDVYSRFSAESGSAQLNESAFYRIRNSIAPDGTPILANCAGEWVVEDLDNDQSWPDDQYVYLGTFDLVQGFNELSFTHYCTLYEQGECPQFHNQDAFSTCDSDNPNSAHFIGDLCLLTSEL